MQTKLLRPLFLLTFLSACATAPKDDNQNVEISKILEDVNSALAKSIPNDPDFPSLTTITLDMQVSVDATIGATVPIQVVSIGPTLNKSNLHHVVVDFVPNVTRTTSSVTPSREESQLTEAISALYKSVAHASPAYKLQHTSIALQCAFKMSGTAGVKLVPVTASASASRQTTQTLTLNFGRDPNRYTTMEGSGASTSSGSSSSGSGSSGTRKSGTSSTGTTDGSN